MCTPGRPASRRHRRSRSGYDRSYAWTVRHSSYVPGLLSFREIPSLLAALGLCRRYRLSEATRQADQLSRRRLRD
ncbi:endonuclease V [Planosporangium flavigriseum]|uniref:endonuclease V n=1 Tax=Planosporangium flavigriseum TaxID=373681 RepID=UPI003570BCC9